MVHVFSGYRTLALCWQFEFSCSNERERVRERKERERSWALSQINDLFPRGPCWLIIEVYLCVIWPFSVNSDCKQGLRDWSDQCVRRQIDRYGYWSEGRSQSILNLFHQNTKPYRASVEFQTYICIFIIFAPTDAHMNTNEHRIDRVWNGNSAKLS